jgi:uncharacterized coiled-coil protein SlyX
MCDSRTTAEFNADLLDQASKATKRIGDLAAIIAEQARTINFLTADLRGSRAFGQRQSEHLKEMQKAHPETITMVDV